MDQARCSIARRATPQIRGRQATLAALKSTKHEMSSTFRSITTRIVMSERMMEDAMSRFATSDHSQRAQNQEAAEN
jgi:hypothetical protein